MVARHKGCGGEFQQYVIREHGYHYLWCQRCGHVFGGERVRRAIRRLMGTKVRPRQERLW